MSFLGAIAGYALRAATAREAAAFEAGDPIAAQRAVLRRLVERAAATRFGRAHRFDRIDGVERYQSSVPLGDYESHWDGWWRADWPILDDVTWPGRIPFFALSSGTTAGPSKRIPVSRAIIAANTRAAKLSLAWHYRARPRSRLTEGVTLMLGGSTAFERVAPGVAAGDLSGVAAVNQPWYAAALTAPTGADAVLSDWDAKLARLAEIATTRRITGLTGTPSWTLLLLEAVAARDPKRCAAPLPDLELYVHGGMSFAPYARRFAELLGPTRPDLREVYPASEGFVAAADARAEDGLRLLHDNGLFFEFVPIEALDRADAPRHWLGTVELGVDYAIAVTSAAGLWSYRIGDVVRFVSLAPPRLRVTGRTKWMLSPFGEHVILAELERAVLAAAEAVGVAVVEFCAAPEFPSREAAAGRHVLAIEPAPGATLDAAGAERFAAAFDAALARLNDDYAAKRRGDVGLRPPRVRVLSPGSVAAWMRARGKLGGQHKAPRVVAAASDLPRDLPPDLRGDRRP